MRPLHSAHLCEDHEVRRAFGYEDVLEEMVEHQGVRVESLRPASDREVPDDLAGINTIVGPGERVEQNACVVHRAAVGSHESTANTLMSKQANTPDHVDVSAHHALVRILVVEADHGLVVPRRHRRCPNMIDY
jgi:hypothetical protein